MRAVIHGQVVDEKGRCRHYQGSSDVVANKCFTCNIYWACHQCHAAAKSHRFGPAPRTALAVVCGACGLEMNYHSYARDQRDPTRPACPGCGHAFNPGCAVHAELYFQPR